MSTQELNKDYIVNLLISNDKAVARALIALADRQTVDEKLCEETKYKNGQGFRPCHARMGTSMAEFYKKNGFLTLKQINYWRKPQKNGQIRISIYANQLLEIAKTKLG
jgi:hypothetical protein